MKINAPRANNINGLEASTLGFGPAAPPTPAALRFVTTGFRPEASRYVFPALIPDDGRDLSSQHLAVIASDLAGSADALSQRGKPSLLNPNGKLPHPEIQHLLGALSDSLQKTSAASFTPRQQSDFSQLKKLSRAFAEFSKSRPEVVVQSHFGYMMDVLLDGCKAVLRSHLVQEPSPEAPKESWPTSLKSNVRSARATMGSLALGSDRERILEHYQRVERSLMESRLSKIAGGSVDSIGLTAHELATCFFAKQNAVATAISERTNAYLEKPSLHTHGELLSELRSATLSLTRTAALTDNPFSFRYNEFRLVLEDFKGLMSQHIVQMHCTHHAVTAACEKIASLLSIEARHDAWSFPGIELTERSLPPNESGQSAHKIPTIDQSATWAREFRPNRAFDKLHSFDGNGVEEAGPLEKQLNKIAESAARASASLAAIVPAQEPFVVGIYNRKESAMLPRLFIDQSVAMQEENRVPESERGPNCGIMTITPADEISRWAEQATVFSVQKGRQLSGALFSFTSQEHQPVLTQQLCNIIRNSPSANLLKPGVPVICSELVLTKKEGREALGKLAENRYVLMNSLWQGSVCSEYYDHETVLCLGVCRKDPPNTAITAHQRLGWKIVPDVEFRFNDRSTYYVMYRELHPRDSLVAQAQKRNESAAAENTRAPLYESFEDVGFSSTRPHETLRALQHFNALPKLPWAKAPFVSLHANRIAATVLSATVSIAAFAPPPPAFDKPKEFLLQTCGPNPITGDIRRDIEYAKHNLTSEDRRDLLKSCLIRTGPNSLTLIDKFYLLSSSSHERATVIDEIRNVVKQEYPQRIIKEITPDKFMMPQTTLLTASIDFEPSK